MLQDNLIAVGLYLTFLVAIGAPTILLKIFFNVPFELLRKMYHLVITLSIFPLVTLFGVWYMAVLAALVLVVLAYPLLTLVEKSAMYQRVAVERSGGEFKRSLIIVQASIALTIFVFWGLLGEEWKWVAVVAVVVLRFGRRRIRHPLIEGPKTMEGTQAMYLTAALAIFLTFLIYANQPWHLSLAVALLVAPVSAVVELFSRRGMDTLTVPISTGLAVLSAMALLSFLGI